MDRLRKRLLVCLILIFAFTLVGFLLVFVSGLGEGNSVSGAAAVGGECNLSNTLAMFMPGLLFIGFLILTVFYLERS